MKKILIVFLGAMLFACQTESVQDINSISHEPISITKIDDYLTVTKFDNGIVEVTHTDDLLETAHMKTATTSYLAEASISPTITVGTGQEQVIITGSGFGNEKGYLRWNGYLKTSRWMIQSWNDSEIRAKVPAGAYTQGVEIIAPDNATSLGTTNTLTVKYGIYPVTVGYDESTWRWQRVAFQGDEIVWRPEIGTDQALIDRVQAQIDRWVCAGSIPMRVGEFTSTDANSSASTGEFVFGRGASAGAAHNSMAYFICSDETAYVVGGRVVFDERDDDAAALHEFGHGVGLPHTNNSGSCMVTSGGKNISSWDAEGARDKMDWSVANTPSCALPIYYAPCVQHYTYFRDSDSDGYGNPDNSITTESSTPPAGYVKNSGDCDDTNTAINPSASEIKGNGIDENCNGMKDDRIKGKGGGGGNNGNGHGNPHN